MGLLTSLLTFPLSGPVAGIRWSLEQVQRVVDEELTDDTPIKQELMELQLQLEVGDISDRDYMAREADLMARLRAVREWREQLGRETSGGPVRVAAPVADVSVAGEVEAGGGEPADGGDSPTGRRAPGGTSGTA